MYDKLANCHPKLRRRIVWCCKCKKSVKISSSDCLKNGWPKCCGQTMTIDSPNELPIR